MVNTYSNLLFLFFFSFFLTQVDLPAQEVVKTVTVEQFTNSSCGICANNIPGFWDTASSFGEDVLVLTFFNPAPYSSCPLYLDAKGTNDQRVNYYDVQGSPSAFIDGEPAPSSIWNNAGAILESHTGAHTALEIKTAVEQDVYSLETEVELVQHGSFEAGENLFLQVFLIEKNVTGGNLSHYQSHHNVVRAQLSPSSGHHFDPLQGSSQRFSFNQPLSTHWNPDELAIVAMVQGENGGIYQSDMGEAVPTSSASVSERRQDFSIFPNPANGMVRIETTGDYQKELRVFNLLGTEVYSRSFRGNYYDLDVSNLHRGVYLVQLKSDRSPARTTRLVLN